jgi:hypothetical protein
MSASSEGRFVGVSQAETDAFVDYDYDLAGLEYEEIVETINEIENVENANVPVHKSKGNETIINIPNSVTNQPSKYCILPYATGYVTINICSNP